VIYFFNPLKFTYAKRGFLKSKETFFNQEAQLGRISMDHLDPIKIPGFQPPITSEVASEAKKKLKETGMDTYEESIESPEDAYIPSEATQSLPQKKKEAFLNEVKLEIAKLNPDSDSFMDEATQKLINSALSNEFGLAMLSDPGYRQMEDVIRRKLLMDPRYRPIIEEFLGKLLESEEQ